MGKVVSSQRRRGGRPERRGWRVLVLFSLAVLAGCTNETRSAQAASGTSSGSIVEVRSASRIYLDAIQSGDARSIEAALADDYVGVDVDGRLLTKRERVQQIVDRTFTISQVRPTEQSIGLSGSTAVFTGVYVLKGTKDHRKFEGPFRYVDVWTKASRGWRVVAGTATRVQGTE